MYSWPGKTELWPAKRVENISGHNCDAEPVKPTPFASLPSPSHSVGYEKHEGPLLCWFCICQHNSTAYSIDQYLPHKSSKSTEETTVHSNLGLDVDGLLATVTAEEQHGKWPAKVQKNVLAYQKPQIIKEESLRPKKKIKTVIKKQTHGSINYRNTSQLLAKSHLWLTCVEYIHNSLWNLYIYMNPAEHFWR